MRLPTPSFLQARSRSRSSVSEIVARPTASPPPHAADSRSQSDKALYLVVLAEAGTGSLTIAGIPAG